MIGHSNFHADAAWEPSLTLNVLPRCWKCHEPHPLARRPALDLDRCPDCGAPAGRPRSEVVPALVTGGPALWLANVFLKIGRYLRGKAKEL